MPIVGVPLGPVTLTTLTDDVIVKTENRESDRLKAEKWVRDALLEISACPGYRNEFDELEVTGPQVQLEVGKREYLDSLFIVEDDVNLNFLDFWLWQDVGTNLRRKQLTWKHYQFSDRHMETPSMPSDWYRFHDQIGFDPTPDKTYTVQARYYRLHPIDDSCIANTFILLPREWWEIVVLTAVERGWIELMEYEKANAVHMLLHGDVSDPRKPGLIAGRLKRRERELWRRGSTLAPVVRPYSSSGR